VPTPTLDGVEALVRERVKHRAAATGAAAPARAAARP
jgi:hypothetical protein